MILTEIFRALSACSRGYDFFRGCYFLVHIWATGHFFQREVTIDYFIGISNMIHNHNERTRHWSTPRGQEEWQELLTHLSGEFIKWKLSWLNGRAIMRISGKYFIELLGLEGIQLYTPLRVLRQFSLIQDVSLYSRTTLYKDDYNRYI